MKVTVTPPSPDPSNVLPPHPLLPPLLPLAAFSSSFRDRKCSGRRSSNRWRAWPTWHTASTTTCGRGEKERGEEERTEEKRREEELKHFLYVAACRDITLLIRRFLFRFWTFMSTVWLREHWEEAQHSHFSILCLAQEQQRFTLKWEQHVTHWPIP